jgi:hypothetical protein
MQFPNRPIEGERKRTNQLTRATLTSFTVGSDDEDEGCSVSDFDSLVATPTPRHKGHAFLPDASHYTVSAHIIRSGEGGAYLIDTFSVE